MTKPSLYLAGPIRIGDSDDIEWRAEAIRILGEWWNIYNPVIRQVNVYTWDRAMIQKSDVVLFNFDSLGSKWPNIGTLWECGLADAWGKVMVAFGDKVWMNHPFIEAKLIWLPNRTEAYEYLIDIVGMYRGVTNGK